MQLSNSKSLVRAVVCFAFLLGSLCLPAASYAVDLSGTLVGKLEQRPLPAPRADVRDVHQDG